MLERVCGFFSPLRWQRRCPLFNCELPKFHATCCKHEALATTEGIGTLAQKSVYLPNKMAVFTFCSDSSSCSSRGRRCTLTSSLIRSPWRSITSRVGQQRWSRCSVAAHSRQMGRSQGWQKSRSSCPGCRVQRTGRTRRPQAFSSSKAWMEWDAVRFCRLRTHRHMSTSLSQNTDLDFPGCLLLSVQTVLVC